MTRLIPCPSCTRHVRQAESGCPFCGAALAFAEAPALPMPTQRLGRAAMFAFGAAFATTGCVGSPTPLYGAPAVDTGTVTADGGNDSGMLAMYGGPGIDAGNDSGGPAPLYGAPTHDSGTVQQDSGGPAPAYGAVPAPDAST